MKLKHLDFVITPEGNTALIKEVSMTQGLRTCSLAFFDDSAEEKTAWWTTAELKKVGNLAPFLARHMAHPFGNGHKTIKEEME